MARITLPKGDESETMRLMQLQPAFAKAMAAYADAIYAQSSLAPRLREAIRMRVAQINQCQICLSFRFPELQAAGVTEAFYAEVSLWQNSEQLSTEEKLVIEYSERFLTDHLNIDDVFFDRLNNNFSSVEVVEITATIAGLLANGRIMQVLQLEQSCAI
jgi:AhpD family alkylhydroperoxidase